MMQVCQGSRIDLPTRRPVEIVPVPVTRRCWCCGETKPLDGDHFSVDRSRKSGRDYACKLCKKILHVRFMDRKDGIVPRIHSTCEA